MKYDTSLVSFVSPFMAHTAVQTPPSPFEQHGVAFSLVVTEGDILTVDVPVASLQLLYQGAFRDCLATQKPVWTHVVGKRGKD